MKDLYELFNDINIDESEFEEMEINDIEKTKIKNNLKKSIKKKNKWKMKGIAAATVLIVSTATFGITFPAYAKNVPIVGDIFRFLDKGKTGLYDNFKENANEINVTKVSNGISVTVNEAIFDGRTLNLTYTIKTDKDFGENINFFPDILWNDGLNTSGFGGMSKFVKVDTNTYVGQQNLTSDDLVKNPKDSINFALKINEISVGEEKSKCINGNWDFDINLNAKKGNTQVINKSFEKEGITATIKEININPMSIFISYSQKVNEEVNKNWSSVYLDLEIKDDLGNIYTGEGNGGSGTSYNDIDWSKTFEKAKNGATKLIITPKATLENGLEGGGVETDSNGNEKSITYENKPKEVKEIVFDDIVVDLAK
ncbi:DUF4179 domain-containing protein [Clostridium tarantellae]|uniref:DUF4179 domain-containing protein n=1 Tax=Clostridium tarantellae TaxID=39493 RepID=A0A6I1MQF6_9CLOT|nr:DUF4179 domain-containing protein [Clostridium tarantellae]MPQ44718.1 DUF4179 domain-containing protein [Clostridium tarantellae]